ncbi:hypothetical protein ACRALDRAFT_2019240 [Sodiomyces alcalophilus JCM 7366]|uniref:uncharacterized protein n=1 Tax=Sodiomyces alcalophilus JCM 7366 TaxID=591952 RepID=UPI0039B5BAC3
MAVRTASGAHRLTLDFPILPIFTVQRPWTQTAFDLRHLETPGIVLTLRPTRENGWIPLDCLQVTIGKSSFHSSTSKCLSRHREAGNHYRTHALSRCKTFRGRLGNMDPTMLSGPAEKNLKLGWWNLSRDITGPIMFAIQTWHLADIHRRISVSSALITCIDLIVIRDAGHRPYEAHGKPFAEYWLHNLASASPRTIIGTTSSRQLPIITGKHPNGLQLRCGSIPNDKDWVEIEGPVLGRAEPDQNFPCCRKSPPTKSSGLRRTGLPGQGQKMGLGGRPGTYPVAGENRSKSRVLPEKKFTPSQFHPSTPSSLKLPSFLLSSTRETIETTLLSSFFFTMAEQKKVLGMPVCIFSRLSLRCPFPRSSRANAALGEHRKEISQETVNCARHRFAFALPLINGIIDAVAGWRAERVACDRGTMIVRPRIQFIFAHPLQLTPGWTSGNNQCIT